MNEGQGGDTIQPITLTIHYDVRCCFFVDVLYKVEELSSIPGLLRAYIYTI